MKIGQYLAKIWTSGSGLLFWATLYIGLRSLIVSAHRLLLTMYTAQQKNLSHGTDVTVYSPLIINRTGNNVEFVIVNFSKN